ncbi:MAG: hypothetical protein NTV36_01140 [Candidatus Staskawiczbacteria bacterium]|nr:hypothetical protein [Candidatus Staskawiczbacteria bacterium]
MSQLPTLGEIILAFKKSDLFGNVKIMVGGPTVTQQYANEIGADGYAPDVIEAVKLARRLVST